MFYCHCQMSHFQRHIWNTCLYMVSKMFSQHFLPDNISYQQPIALNRCDMLPSALLQPTRPRFPHFSHVSSPHQRDWLSVPVVLSCSPTTWRKHHNTPLSNKLKSSFNLQLLAKAYYSYCNQLIDAQLLYMYINTDNLATDIYFLDGFFIFSLHCLNLTHDGFPIQIPYKTRQWLAGVGLKNPLLVLLSHYLLSF